MEKREDFKRPCRRAREEGFHLLFKERGGFVMSRFIGATLGGLALVLAIMIPQASALAGEVTSLRGGFDLTKEGEPPEAFRLDIPEQILSVLSKSALPPSKLVIEVTETSVAKEVIQALDVLTRLRMRGVQLSIDDFGTGYATLQQLQIVPFNELKLDVSYVRRAHEHASSRAIVETTIDLGHRLGKTVVAEGVETEEVWHLLAGLGCDLAQGYFIARPMPGEQVSTWLAQWKRRFPLQPRPSH